MIISAILCDGSRQGKPCTHKQGTPCTHKGNRCGKEEMESFLKILNQNEDWEIRYELVPKAK